MPNKRLAKAREGYEDYVYRTPPDWYGRFTANMKKAMSGWLVPTPQHPADASSESEPGYGAGV